VPARNCHRLHIEAGSIPRPPTDPTGYVQPPGCAESTFVGSDFDIEQVALQGVGSTVQALVDQERVGDSITILCSVPCPFSTRWEFGILKALLGMTAHCSAPPSSR
jgi:hypothetical protein